MVVNYLVKGTANPDLNNNNCHDNLEVDIKDDRNPADEATGALFEYWPS